MLLDRSQVEFFRSSQVEGGKIGSFTVHAYVDREFIEAGRRDQNTFYYPPGDIPHIAMPIEVRILIYGADRKDRVATSPELGIVYSNGRQIEFIRQRKPAVFETYDSSGISVFPMHEPIPASAASFSRP